MRHLHRLSLFGGQESGYIIFCPVMWIGCQVSRMETAARLLIAHAEKCPSLVASLVDLNNRRN